MSNEHNGFETAAPAPSRLYWEDRARRFAAEGKGLAAVCSYGMPDFYNRYIHLTQHFALRPWLRQVGRKQVLDVGCGVGRWSRLMAAQGAQVTGVDLSSTMVAEARRRSEIEGLSERCEFMVGDLAELNTGRQYDFILGVTVLQHILELEALRAALRRLAAHMTREGRMVLIEAAPSQRNSRCDSRIFEARNASTYMGLFAESGLAIHAMTGVDPMPLKTSFLPYYRRLPRAIALAGLAGVTALSLPVDLAFGRRFAQSSWHKLFVLQAGRPREWQC